LRYEKGFYHQYQQIAENFELSQSAGK